MEKIIEVLNLTKRYGDFTAVNNISFYVNKGEIFAAILILRRAWGKGIDKKIFI